MSKFVLRGEQKMTDAAYVAEAQGWAKALICKLQREQGWKKDYAMQRAPERWGIDYSTFWALHYRPPERGLLTGVYMRLKAAYEYECQRQEARLAHELMLTKAAGRNAANSNAVAQVEAFLREKESTP